MSVLVTSLKHNHWHLNGVKNIYCVIKKALILLCPFSFSHFQWVCNITHKPTLTLLFIGCNRFTTYFKEVSNFVKKKKKLKTMKNATCSLSNDFQRLEEYAWFTKTVIWVVSGREWHDAEGSIRRLCGEGLTCRGSVRGANGDRRNSRAETGVAPRDERDELFWG